MGYCKRHDAYNGNGNCVHCARKPHGMRIELTGDEVAMAIDAFLISKGIHVNGPRTVLVNGRLCEAGAVIVDPSGSVARNGETII